MRPRLPRFIFSAVLVASAPLTAAAQDVSPEALMDGLNSVFGKHKARGSHAKGVCVKGTFEPSADAAKLSKAPPKAGPVLARFSVGGGNPAASDKEKSARGLALRFDPDGAPSDLVLVNAPIHFAQTLEQMIGFLAARAKGPDGKPDPEKVKEFSKANPVTTKQKAFLDARPLPASYAGVNYWAVHAFPVENAEGAVTNVKIKALPKAGELGLSEEEAKAKPADFLKGEITERLSKEPASFDLVAIVGQEGDSLDEVTVEWPEAERKQVPLGTVTIAAIEPDATCDAIIFDPTNLPEGVGQPKDPIFPARSPTYALSKERRSE